ncbi:DMT family transporter [Thermococcus waiotapuensis]|uniref:DMT family transporter n=1 Tax=Thermococcus waiotapuensis TaxID=90909 RepID=A0AAE4NTM0_9EURY|nr:DMT family transporter [Thermococcus waiotapuensis]MDV3104113.1 DMT family transporter [Thermococcus waiotapuensis]
MKRAELILLLVTVFWGLTFPVMKISISYMPPLLFLAYRFGVASAFMLLIFRSKAIKKETVFEGFILGITLFLGHAFQTIGLEYTTPSNSAFITSLYVVFTPFIAYFLLGDKIKKNDGVSLLIAIAGLYLISGAGKKVNHGDILTVLCAISFAFQIVLVQKFQGSDYISLSFWQIFWNFLFSLTSSKLLETPILPTNPASWLGILYTSLFATVIAFTAQVKYQGETTAYRAALIYSTEPLFGTLGTVIIMRAIPSVRELIGAGLIMMAVWIAIKEEDAEAPLSF